MRATADQIVRFIRFARSTRKWLGRFSQDASTTVAEREGAISIRRYVARATEYALGPKPDSSELERRLRKADHACQTLHIANLRRRGR